MDSFNTYRNKARADLAIERILAQQESFQSRADLNLNIYDVPITIIQQVIKDLIPGAWKLFLLNLSCPIAGPLRRRIHPVLLDQITILVNNIELNYDCLSVEAVTLILLIRDELLKYWREFIAEKIDPLSSSFDKHAKFQSRNAGGFNERSGDLVAGQSKRKVKPALSWNPDGTKDPLPWRTRLFRRNEVEEIIDTRRKSSGTSNKIPATLAFEQPIAGGEAESSTRESAIETNRLRGQRSEVRGSI